MKERKNSYLLFLEYKFFLYKNLNQKWRNIYRNKAQESYREYSFEIYIETNGDIKNICDKRVIIEEYSHLRILCDF
jgi:hypothetical protein